jgi:hypothetical protein
MSAMNLQTMTPDQIKSVDRTLSGGTWAITAMAITFSLFTVTPLVERVTPDGWKWSAIGLSLLVDVALVIVIRMDAAVSRLGAHVKGWPAVLRWLTGLSSVLLNIGDSALKGDKVGVAVHAVAPLVLVAVSEAGPKYRQAITDALDRIAREQREQADRERAEREAREQRARKEREHERAETERREREAREHAERLDRDRLDREERRIREEREHEAELERLREEREDRRRREEQERQDRERAEQREREERERREQQEQADREARERRTREQAARAEREQAPAPRREQRAPRTVNGAARPALTAVPVNGERRTKMPELEARAYVDSFRPGQKTVRELADETGWSVGWVSGRLRQIHPPEVG